MQKAITNRTDKEVVLAGTKIPAKTQHTIYEELITKEELEELVKNEFSLKICVRTIDVVLVDKADTTVTGSDADVTGGQDSNTNTGDGTTQVVLTPLENVYTYPKELINNKGMLTGFAGAKPKIKSLQAQYGDLIIPDATFTQTYSGHNADNYRVAIPEEV